MKRRDKVFVMFIGVTFSVIVMLTTVLVNVNIRNAANVELERSAAREACLNVLRDVGNTTGSAN